MHLAFAIIAATLLFIGGPVSAHPLDIAYLDFGVPKENELTLTAAIHPYQAFELVRAGSAARFELAKLKESGELISAYVQNHVSVQRNGQDCSWDAQSSAHVPGTELEAVADGITVAGRLECPGEGSVLDVESTIFLDGYPNQTSVLRLETPNGFAERLTLNRDRSTASLDLAPILAGGEWSAVSSTSQTSGSRRPDAAILEIAGRLLDPGLGWLGFMGLLIAAAAIGALHALGPGHGKSLLAAVLIGEQATVGRAVTLASVMTATHVADVFLMALLAGVIAVVLPPTELIRWLELISAAGLLGLGLFSLFRAIRRYREAAQHPVQAVAADEEHARMHALGIGHTHASQRLMSETASPLLQASTITQQHPTELLRPSLVELPASATSHDHLHDPTSFRRSLWTGFLGSLAPCPTAWAMFMATISLGRPGAGALLLIAFSLGLYATVVAIGLLLVFSKKYALRHTPPRFTYTLPIISASVISLLGGWLLLR